MSLSLKGAARASRVRARQQQSPRRRPELLSLAMECRAWKPFTRSSTLPLACASGQGMWAAAAIQEVSATTPSSAAAPVSSPFAQQASLARFSSPQQQHHHQRQQDSSTASAGAVPPPEDGGTRLHSPPQGDSGAPHTSERDTVTAVQQEAPAAAAPAAAASSGGARGQQGEPRLAHEQVRHNDHTEAAHRGVYSVDHIGIHVWWPSILPAGWEQRRAFRPERAGRLARQRREHSWR